MADGDRRMPAARAAESPDGESSSATAAGGGAQRLSASIGLGVGLDGRVTSSLPTISSKASARPAASRTVSTLARQVVETTAEPDPAPSRPTSRRRPDRPGRVGEQGEGQLLLAARPSPRRRRPRSSARRRARRGSRGRRSRPPGAATSSASSQPITARVRCQAATWTFSVSAITPSKSNSTARGGIGRSRRRNVGR